MRQENSDIELIRQAITGDKAALETIVEMYQSFMHALARNMVNDQDAINDIVQEASILVYRYLYQLRDPSSFQTWLASIVRNTARRYLSKQSRTPLSLEVLQTENFAEIAIADNSISDPYEEIERKFVATTVLDRVMQLSMKERYAIFLFYYLGYSIQEIMDILNITESSVKSRLYKARKHLAVMLPPFLHSVATSVKAKRSTKMMPFDEHIPSFTHDQIVMYQYAISEASKLGHKRLGTEHILLGITHATKSDIAYLLAKEGIEEEKVRDLILLGYSDLDTNGPGITSQLRKVLEMSYELERRLNSSQIGCAHMLWSSLQIKHCGAWQILESLHIEIESFSAAIISFLIENSTLKKVDETDIQLLKDIHTLSMRSNEQKDNLKQEKLNYLSLDEHIRINKNLMQKSKYAQRKEELERWNDKITRIKEITAEYSMEPRFPPFALSTAAILSLAEQEAKKYSARVSPTFLFLSFMQQENQPSPPKSSLLHTFETLGVNRSQIYHKISVSLEQGEEEFVLRRGNALDNVYLASWSDISILSYEAAIRRRSLTIEPEHLFLGLLRYLEFTSVPTIDAHKEFFCNFELALALATGITGSFN